MPRILLAGAIMLALLVSGCKIGGHNSSSSNANVRVLNVAALAGFSPIGMSVASGSTTGTPEVSGLGFEQISDYQSYGSGSANTIQILVGSSNAVLTSITETFNSTNYTLVVYGSSGEPGTFLLEDDTNNVSPGLNGGNFFFRPLNTAIATGPLDVYLMQYIANPAPGTPNTCFLVCGPNFADFTVGGLPIFQQFLAGQYVIVATQSGSKTPIYQSAPMNFAAGDVITVNLFSSGSGLLVDAYAMNQNTSSTTLGLYASQFSRFKLANAGPTSGAVVVQYNGITDIQSTSYGTASNYAAPVMLQAPNTFNVLSATTGQSVLAPQTGTNPPVTAIAPNFVGGNDYSAVLIGDSADTVLMLQDYNLPPASGYANVRFVNAAPSTGAISVSMNSIAEITSLATNTASAYQSVQQNTFPGYIVTASVAQGTPPPQLQDVELFAGGTYTIYVMGDAGSLQIAVTRDN